MQKTVQPPLGTGYIKNNPGMNTTTLNTPTESFVSSIVGSDMKRFDDRLGQRSESPQSDLKSQRADSPASVF